MQSEYSFLVATYYCIIGESRLTSTSFSFMEGFVFSTVSLIVYLLSKAVPK